MKTKKLRQNEKNLLFEAVRRYFLKKENQNLDCPFLGLGTEVQYRNLMKLGYMQFSYPTNKECFKYDNWFKLTNTGKILFQQILDTGINKFEYEKIESVLNNVVIPNDSQY
jgi:hypothetical protein